MQRIISYIFSILCIIIFIPQQVIAASADAELELRFLCEEGQTCPEVNKTDEIYVVKTPYNKDAEFTLEIVLKNPSQQVITSVQSWLNYDAMKLEGLSVEPTNVFDLIAPGEKDFDSDNNRVKIGFASTTGGVNQPEIVIAKITFKVLSNQSGPTEITFYDYQVSELGHTTVNIIDDNFPVNILSSAPPGVRIPLNGGTLPVNIGGPTNSQGDPIQVDPLLRPHELKISTGNQYAYLQWIPSEDSKVKGYHIYYGTKSTKYMHRKNVGGVNSFYLNDLQNDARYYFAITGYDIQGNESDYSDEETIIINHPETSSSPIITIPTDIRKAETGPETLFILIPALIAGIIGFIFSIPKKKKKPLYIR